MSGELLEDKMQMFRWIGIFLCLGFLITACDRQTGEESVVETKGLSIQANMVFFYYHDLDAAEKFYSEILVTGKDRDDSSATQALLQAEANPGEAA